MILTINEAAKYLRCGPKVVRRLCKLKRLPHRVIDRKGTIRLHRQALDNYLLEQNPGPQPVGIK